MEKITRIATENQVVIFSKSSCCLSYAVSILFQGLGVIPVEYYTDRDPDGRQMEEAIARMGCKPPVPAVFIAGKLVGSTNEIMSLHLNGSLVHMLRASQGSKY